MWKMCIGGKRWRKGEKEGQCKHHPVLSFGQTLAEEEEREEEEEEEVIVVVVGENERKMRKKIRRRKVRGKERKPRREC